MDQGVSFSHLSLYLSVPFFLQVESVSALPNSIIMVLLGKDGEEKGKRGEYIYREKEINGEGKFLSSRAEKGKVT